MVCDGPASHRPPFSECTWGVFAVFVKNHSWMLNEIVLDGQYYASFCLSPCVSPAYLFLSLVFSGVVFGENSWAPREWESVFPWEPVMLG